MLDYSSVLNKQRDFFDRGRSKDIGFRLNALKKLKKAIQEQETGISDALREDLGKSPSEAYATEIGIILHELSYTIRRLRRWASVKYAGTPLMHFPSASRMIPEPYGIVLIMSPWNYPFQLTLAPLIGALAAGNCAVIKPSAYSPATSGRIASIIHSCFHEGHVAVLEGGREANEALLNEKFDYIFFTGSMAVGKKVMESASRYLTPVTLELGGKSPCIVCADADVDLAARRIIWGKTLNAGQTCVAPDYVLAHRAIARPLAQCMKKYIAQFFGEEPCQNPEYPHMINEKHFNRVADYLKDGEIFSGGRTDREKLRIEPTLLLGVDKSSPAMQEELFGPVLPILEFDELEEVLSFVKGRAKPLALYLFTKNRHTEKEILGSISFGGGCVNDTIIHLANSALPFGGVGASGTGGYHGKWSFETFTHWKSVLKKSNFLDITLRYPPYGKKLSLFKTILK